MKRNKVGTVLTYVFLIFMAAFAVVPILQVFINSFRVDGDVKQMPIGLPKTFTLANYPDSWEIGGYGPAYISSLIIAACTVFAVLLVTGLAAYALAKLRFKGRRFFDAYFFAVISLPQFLYIVPVYFMFNRIGILDTRISLIVVYIATNIPFNVLLLKTFLAGIPREIEEAAKIDGCTEIDTFMRITVPMMKSVFITVGILVFVACWNEFLWANTFIVTPELKPVSTRYINFTGQYSSNMARLYTASVLTIAPVIALYIFFSDRFIEGLTSGSVKG